MKKLLLCLLFVPTVFTAQAQDSDIHITIDNVDLVLDEFFESLGESIELAVSCVSETNSRITITIDERTIEASAEKFGEAMERLGESIEHAVENMSIELKDLDPDDIKRGKGKVNGADISDIIEDVEDEYGQEIRKVDRMFIRFSKDTLKIEMDVTLENGKEIKNIKKTIRN